MPHPQLVLSTVGISLLLNGLLPEEENEWKKRLNLATNTLVLEDAVASKVAELKQRAADRLQTMAVPERRRISAELNGLYGLYEGQLDRARRDVLYLVTTDTAMGQATADVLCAFLRPYAAQVAIYVPPRLSTATRMHFADGMKALINWCEECVPGYQQQGYRVIFNLTGGFKSLQGYLNIIGMFYADEMIYIFETGSAVLAIPKLPIQIDYAGLRHYSAELEMMNAGHLLGLDAVAGLPGAMIEIVTEHDIEYAGLSTWGALIWNRARDAALSDDLLAFPRLRYSDRFRKEFQQADRRMRIELQGRLAKVSALLEDSQGDTSVLKRDGGLRYKDYIGHVANGKPIGHFYINQGDRVSCVAERGGLLLRRFGPHTVNDNP